MFPFKCSYNQKRTFRKDGVGLRWSRIFHDSHHSSLLIHFVLGRAEGELSAAKTNPQGDFQVCSTRQALAVMTVTPDTKAPRKSADGTSRQGRQTEKSWTAKPHVQALVIILFISATSRRTNNSLLIKAILRFLRIGFRSVCAICSG